MPFEYDYDPAESGDDYETPPVNEPVMVTIGQCDNATSNAGNDMLVLNCKVNHDQEGSGFRFKEYLVKGVNWKLRQVMRSVGVNLEEKHHIDDLFFRDRQGLVLFKAEKWTGDDGEERTSYKPAKWVKAESSPKGVEPAQKSADKVADSPAVQVQITEDPVYTEDQIPF